MVRATASNGRLRTNREPGGGRIRRRKASRRQLFIHRCRSAVFSEPWGDLLRLPAGERQWRFCRFSTTYCFHAPDGPLGKKFAHKLFTRLRRTVDGFAAAERR